MAAPQDLKALQGFIDETKESLQGIESAFIKLENDPANMVIVGEIFRPVHSMKGNSGFFGLTNINNFAHRLENLLDFIRKGELTVDKEIINVLLTGIEFLQSMLDRVQENPEDVVLRPEEETFLAERVDPCRPKGISGTFRSVEDLAALLQEAQQEGLDLHDTPFINKILDQAEQLRLGLSRFLEEHRRAIPVLPPANAVYHYQEVDRTAAVAPLVKVLSYLEGGQAVPAECIAAAKVSLPQLETILTSEPGISDIVAELGLLINFLDDSFLAAATEYQRNLNKLILDILGRFTITALVADRVQKIGEILIEKGKISPEQLDQALGQQNKVGALLLKDGVIGEKDLTAGLDTQRRQISQVRAKTFQRTDTSKTIRIDQSKLDEFAESVGELFITVDSFAFLRKRLEQIDAHSDLATRFANTITSLDNGVSRLQENLMDIRKVPVKTLFQRFPKVVRQLAVTVEKEINFTVSGEDTVIDKDLLEKIENPLVHLLRNAVDHGLEGPAERAESNKTATGLLELTAAVDENDVRFVIRDDGRGIDPAKMRQVAVKKGMLSEEEVKRLTDREAVQLIFKAGFSSADKVSDISGRGVGLDVVMNCLQECSGTIDVESAVGTGTTIRIKIPLTKTLVTKDALIVEAAGQLFAIPSEEITSTFYPEEFISLLDAGRGVSYKNSIHRIIDLGEFFYGRKKERLGIDPNEVLIIVSRYQCALLVDKMYNHQKVVVKNFGKGYPQLHRIPGIKGFTILGNEDIVLLTDTAGLVETEG